MVTLFKSEPSNAVRKGLYTGNGSTKEFNISFAYIEEGHIKVALNEVATTAFTVDTSTSPKKVVMNTLASETSTQTTTGAPKSGVAVLVFRDTPLNNALVDYTDGSTLIADDLDKSNQQFLFLLQEQDDEQAANIQSTLPARTLKTKRSSTLRTQPQRSTRPPKTTSTPTFSRLTLS